MPILKNRFLFYLHKFLFKNFTKFWYFNIYKYIKYTRKIGQKNARAIPEKFLRSFGGNFYSVFF